MNVGGNQWSNAGTSGDVDGCPVLLNGFGGPAGYGSGVLAGNDDDSSEAIPLAL